MDDARYLYRVDLLCDGNVSRGVFYGSDEDIALSYCLQYTGIRKLSSRPEWKLAVYEVLIDEIDLSQELLIGMFDQDGYVVPLPEVDLDVLKMSIQQAIDMHGPVH